MNIPILCLAEIESARSLNQQLADEKIPARIVSKGAPAKPVFVVESEGQHEPDILKTARERINQKSILSCPSCRSSRIDFPALPDKSATMRFMASLVAKPVDSGEAAFSCRSCHYEWTATRPESPVAY